MSRLRHPGYVIAIFASAVCAPAKVDAAPTSISRKELQHTQMKVREVSAILDAKAPGDAAAFKVWLRGISQTVAEASKEGSFLGVGGVQVSDAERATLADSF